MRLVLLPGLNGSSHLFGQLVQELAGIPSQILQLPEQGPQDHDALAQVLFPQLGDTPFVLLGESFSGPLAYRLALRQPPGLCGVIFAASFLQRPTALLPLAHRLPLPKVLLSQALPLKLFCLGNAASPESLRLLQKEIRRLSPALVRARLRSLAELAPPEASLALPALHIWPEQDRLVRASAAASLAQHCENYRAVRLEGPHFILQTQAPACAKAIREFIEQCDSDQSQEAGRMTTSPGFP